MLQEKANKLLISGEFLKIKTAKDIKEHWYQVAADVFLGNLEEAAATVERNKKHASSDVASACLFFLLIGNTRKSDYSTAFKILKEQKALIENVESKFFIFQSYAFLNFFYSRFTKTKYYAEKALHSAIDLDFSFGKIISYDLLGHSLVQTGEIEDGKRFLQKAKDMALIYGPSRLADSIDTSILKFTCQFSDKTNTSLQAVEEKILTLSTQDTYSLSELLLEKSRLLQIQGKADEAEKVLEEAGSLIFRFKHKRHIAILNLRYAYLSWIQGDSIKALSLLQAALSSISTKVDKVLELKIKGLEYKILKQDLQANEVEALSKGLNITLANRILSRETGKTVVIPKGQDTLGDLIDGINKKTTSAIQKCIQDRSLGLLQFLLPKPGNYLLVDPMPGYLVLWTHGNAVTIDVKKSSLHRKIFLYLATTSLSKEQLIERVWGYMYDPLRHDSLIYQTMKNIRAEIASNLLESIDGKYQLANKYEVIHFSEEMNTVVTTESMNIHTETQAIYNHYNYRQNLFLKSLKTGEFISPQEYAKRYKVSRITASRDLNQLLNEHKILSTGKGRSIRYYVRSL